MLIADRVRQHLKRPNFAARLILDLSASGAAAKYASAHAIRQTMQCLHLNERADLNLGKLTVRLSEAEYARVLGCNAERVKAEELTITSQFRTRRRGVELKLHLGHAPPEVDVTLVQNIVKAQSWMAMLIEGNSFTEIAQAKGTLKLRVQDVVELVMLASDILGAIAAGSCLKE